MDCMTGLNSIAMTMYSNEKRFHVAGTSCGEPAYGLFY